MNKKHLLSLVTVIVVCNWGVSLAGNNVWMGWTDTSWNTVTNWSLGKVPTADVAFMEDRGKTYPYPVITDSNEIKACAHLKFNQYADGGRLDIESGTLNVGGIAYINIGGSYSAELNISGGELIIGTNLFFPYAGTATLNMSGGKIEASGTLVMCQQASGDGFMDLTGGIVEAADFLWNTGPSRFNHINITEGALKINSTTNLTDTFLDLIDSDDITAYGSGTTRYDWVSHPRAFFNIDFNGSSTTLSAGIQDLDTAWNPSPGIGELVDNISGTTTLSWSSGDSTRAVDGHDIYFGTDLDEVTNADTGSAVYLGRQTANDINVGQLDLDETYYWRVDEIDDSAVVHKGYIWNFKTLPGRVVCDFDSYADTAALTTDWTVVGGASANLQDTFIGYRITTEEQSMIFEYDNGNSPYYSEVYADTANLPDFIDASDWNWLGTETLYVQLHGDLSNEPNEPLFYIGLKDSGSTVHVVYYPDMEDLVQEGWEDAVSWNIPLSDFGGVDLNDIQRIYFGFGDRDNPQAGSAGKIYVDSITLFPPRCVPMNNQGGDIGYYEFSDCTADDEDILALAGGWIGYEGGTITAVAPTVNPVLHYTFEDSGYTVTDQAGTYDGTVSGTLGWDTDGYIGNCYEFDGATSFIDVDGLVIDNLGSAFTITCWIKAPSSSNPSGFICNAKETDDILKLYLQTNEWPDNPQQAVYLSFAAGDSGWPTGDSVTLGSIYTSPVGYLSQASAKEWTHLAVVKNITDGVMKLYINGKLYVVSSGEDQALGAEGLSFDLLRLGANASNPAQHLWEGKLDEFRIYNAELTHGEILTLAGYSPGNTLEQPSVSWADLNGDTKVNLVDFSKVAKYWLEVVLWP